jgi:hypothetical protein
VLAATKPVDFTKGGEGLAALVREATPAQLGYLLEGIDWRLPQQTFTSSRVRENSLAQIL